MWKYLSHPIHYFGRGVLWIQKEIDNQHFKRTIADLEAGTIKKYQQENFHPQIGEKKQTFGNKIPIWICWWQGMENAPALVRACFESVKRNAPDNATVVVITQDTYKNYIDLPDYILNHLTSKRMTVTHFSDILRTALLAIYGGLWIDATIYVGKPIPPELLQRDFFTRKTFSPKSHNIAKGRWSAYLIGQKEKGIYANFLYESFLEYWKQMKELVHYNLVDFTIANGNSSIKAIHRMLKENPVNNRQIHIMQGILNQKYDKTVFDKLVNSETTFHKLSYKIGLPLYTPEGEETVYNHLLQICGVCK